MEPNDAMSKLKIECGSFHFEAEGREKWIEEALEKTLCDVRITGLANGARPSKPASTANVTIEKSAYGPKATRWLQQNGIVSNEIDQVFHNSDGALEIIAQQIPGETKKSQTVNAYLLEGARALLQSDMEKIDPQQARALCIKFACMDESNHSTNVKALGNRAVGSAKDYFTLTAPGLQESARLVKSMAGGNGDS